MKKKDPSEPSKKAEKKVKKEKKVVNKKVLKRAEGEECFFLVNGSVVSDLMELADALESMSHDVYYYHVNKDKHDFSAWVKGVMQEAELAEKLLATDTPEKSQIVILRHFLK